ncbi:MAG TPA: ATP-dependent metallopeptidase FtsH/Yme1/Tma family protein, partial [Candidatus Paceibacterota bacterium]|nr:ATP-dependent metallopeptidase FtsH/Yme1/Tma family protein [Candidatus Paceibacterota bacterium]
MAKQSPTEPNKDQKKNGKGKKPLEGGREKLKSVMPGGPSFLTNLLTTVVVFLLLMGAYSFITTTTTKTQTISLTQVANDVKAGKVENIAVNGDDVTLAYADGSHKKAMKDPSQALQETLVNYGATPDELSKVSITIQSQSGFKYWFAALAPTLITIVLLGIVFFFLLRQMRGAGMQAFTFGQSKARLTDPEDQSTRVTFADVAGA